MAHRYSASVQGGAGTTALPSASIYAGANKDLRLKEVHIFNTTATEVLLRLMKLNTAGTKPAAVADLQYDIRAPSAEGGVSGTHTVGPAFDSIAERIVLGAAIGSGVILTFGLEGILIALGVANGIGLVLTSGVGQVCEYTFVWEE